MVWIQRFDPWRSTLCTCPFKYSLNIYTGCAHACIYCYITSYIRDGFKPRPKRGLIGELERELQRFHARRKVVSISNSSDPYQPIEKKLELTRKCLELFKRFGWKILIVTKSNLITRDLDLLKEDCVVSVTITTLDSKLAHILEPNAPSPSLRIDAIKLLKLYHIPVCVRIDPLIPFINDDWEKLEKLVKILAKLKVDHVISSTYKARGDSLARLSLNFPERYIKLLKLYLMGERISNYYYLPRDLRYRLMSRLKQLCEEYGLSFASCREGFRELNDNICDGSFLLS
ncbi:MAG: radical SAM protein [Candidatus Nanoarchaeia archaeon]|nr:radical SAM protein [Candidatus Haiyanarchaeum thermophilum]MCW1303095.1 radical SAM protein [Candidatus Haiyanarchaeum thermophilum]MCW1303760.1 radical SAM protein [Candidatus Haiyanarchaeum thermophilum]MCW1306625.1 radical SAM protein [Candidatus Haiyanarchaeum thermophilum]MCW1307037.1 radical SAM protein [Candidatus Haiyanarchaeum thermophilum]